MDHLLRRFLGKFIHSGSITFTTAGGAKFTCGDGTGTHVAARFLTRQAEFRILLNPELALGEAYMDGSIIVEQGSIADLLAVLMGQPEMLPGWAKPQWWARYLVRHSRQFNSRGNARRNVAHHYDLEGRLYSLFLDFDRQYSCAYFDNTGRKPRRRPARQKTSPRRQAPGRARPSRARYRFGLGRAWALSRRNDRRRRHRYHALERAVAGIERARGGERTSPVQQDSGY